MKVVGYVDAAAVGVDAVAAPANVPPRNVTQVPTRVPGTAHAPQRLVFWSRGAGGNVVGQLYVLDETTAALAVANQVWRKFGDEVTIPTDTAVPLVRTDGTGQIRPVVPFGQVYFRVTAGNGANVTVQVGVT
jgi:hypothetical protein